eukprot:CAMPEP_0174369514 /NCGR_PEP_ID=MMETSP0811_2-20130205/92780_1 /TAXON_ID=73025 ORGANISM="Eutreptiella gymnastica-like, Strain CCMP1594" /NCGR_SAMPLE_ID=MMETSP0811_2 /ASSEMBLY_ACC=CAM_ASM_000667 /LENGTH=203 /DNA_ID=CAMNT_0015514041 /DNA_START=20 /DNA_END=627 /DNA_ORIENTATION=+
MTAKAKCQTTSASKGADHLPESLPRAFEIQCAPLKCTSLAGIDEAGRGPLAGPVVAAACVVPFDLHISGIADSKTITTEAQREQVYDMLTSEPRVQWSVGVVDNNQIDKINILQAAMLSMDIAAQGLACTPDYVLVDGPRLPEGVKQKGNAMAVVKGDSKCFSIAAASIIAKVTRDRLMHQYHAQYPEYNFAQHKGYPTGEHV